MARALALVCLLVACSSDNGAADAAIDAAPTCTLYLGPAVYCDSAHTEVCIDVGNGSACEPVCSESGSACPADERYHTLATDTGHVCYCTPP